MAIPDEAYEGTHYCLVSLFLELKELRAKHGTIWNRFVRCSSFMRTCLEAVEDRVDQKSNYLINLQFAVKYRHGVPKRLEKLIAWLDKQLTVPVDMLDGNPERLTAEWEASPLYKDLKSLRDRFVPWLEMSQTVTTVGDPKAFLSCQMRGYYQHCLDTMSAIYDQPRRQSKLLLKAYRLMHGYAADPVTRMRSIMQELYRQLPDHDPERICEWIAFGLYKWRKQLDEYAACPVIDDLKWAASSYQFLFLAFSKRFRITTGVLDLFEGAHKGFTPKRDGQKEPLTDRPPQQPDPLFPRAKDNAAKYVSR